MSDDNDGSDFPEVELSPKSISGSHFLIEEASCCFLSATFLFTFTFIAVHAFAAFCPPSSAATKTDSIEPNISGSNLSFDVDIFLNVPVVTSAGIKLTFSAAGDSNPGPLPTEILIHANQLFNRHLLTANDSAIHSNLSFAESGSQTYPEVLFRSDLSPVDRLQLHLTIRTDYSRVDRFIFKWDLSTATSENYLKTAKLFLSVLIAYMLVLFISSLTFDSQKFTQLFALLVGAMGVLASNPVGFFLGWRLSFFDDFVTATFTAVCRLFVLIQLELLRTNGTVPSFLFAVLLSLLFSVYAAIEMVASYEARLYSEFPFGLRSETALNIANFVYAVAGFLYVFMAFRANNGLNVRRLGFFTIWVVVEGIVNVGLPISLAWFGPSREEVMPEVLAMSVNMTLAGIMIFLLQTGEGHTYDLIDAKRPPMVIDLDQLTDSGKGDDSSG
jgi:hypothetical protein